MIVLVLVKPFPTHFSKNTFYSKNLLFSLLYAKLYKKSNFSKVLHLKIWKKYSNLYTRYFATLNYVEFWKSKELSREITMASKIPIWLFLKGFGYILINNPAQQGLHHHYLVKRLKELPFPMKSMTLMHRLSFHEFHILYSYLCKPFFFYSVISSQKKFIEFFPQFDTNKHTQRKSLYGAQGLPR